MKVPLQAPRHDELELDPQWKPLPYFTIRKEDFGYLLVRYNWSVPVSHDAKELIEAIDGETSLGQLLQRFGDEGLELIGHLYRQGCVEFE